MISLSYILQLCWDMIKILHIRILSQIWSKMQAMNYISSWSFYAAVFFSSVQFSRSVMSNSATLWAAAHQAALSITNSRSLLKLMSIEPVMPSNHLILCCLLFLPPSICPSIRVFSSESVLCIRWPNYWSFSFIISPSNEHPELISFRMDWLDLLAVQGSQESFPSPKFKNINSLVLSCLYSQTLTSMLLLEKL